MKIYTQEELTQVAKDFAITESILKGVIDIQSKAVGTLVSNHAKIVFQRWKFQQNLREVGLTSIADDLAKHWDELTQVNLYVVETLRDDPTVNEVKQEQRFDNVLQLIYTLRPELAESTRKQITECAYKACTIGLGQILGKYFEQCGYTEFHTFIDDMYSSELNQLKALAKYMIRKGTTTNAKTASQAIQDYTLFDYD